MVAVIKKNQQEAVQLLQHLLGRQAELYLERRMTKVNGQDLETVVKEIVKPLEPFIGGPFARKLERDLIVAVR